MTHSHTHGSHNAWGEVYQDLDLSYSEQTNTQGKLFELVKIDFLSKILPKPPVKILEVGCGTAYVSLYFAKRGYLTTCLDVNKFILETAEKNFQKEAIKGDFVVGDAEKLPFKTGSFDVVTSFGLLEHFENPSIAITEMVRVLKPGGLLFADIVPNRFSVQSFGNIFNALAVFFFYLLKGKPILALQKAINNFKPHYFENSISWQDYQKMIHKAGVKRVEVRGNRPFPRLTLPKSLDKVYAKLLKPTTSLWREFDNWDSLIPRVWGAGLWFWGQK
jgi:ubiquinone/menaquinone biosynthesis C-methylase UbiE